MSKAFKCVSTVVVFLNAVLIFTTSGFCSQDILPVARLGMGTVRDVKFSPNGRYLAVGGSIGIWLYDATVLPPKPITLLKPRTWGSWGGVTSFAFSPDGRLLASGDLYYIGIKLWDVESRESVATLEGHTDVVSSIAFSPNGRLLASGSKDGTILLWDVESRETVATLSREGYLVAFSPDGRLLASGARDGTIKLWDVESREYIATLEGHTDVVFSIAFSPDGHLLASGSSDETIRLWDVESRECIVTLSREGYLVTFSPDGSLLTSGSSDDTIKLWDMESREYIATLEGHTDVVSSIAFSPNGRLLASGSSDDTIKLWDVENRECIDTLRGHTRSVYSIAFSPDGELLAAGLGGDTGLGEGTIKLWDVEGRECIATLEGHTDVVSSLVSSVAFSPTGKLLASGSWDGTIKLWDVESRKCIATFEGPDVVSSIAFSPDGRLLASGSWDGTIKLWGVESRKCIATLEEHPDWWVVSPQVFSVAFSPDGRLLASGSWDETIKLWDVESRECIATLKGHTSWVFSVAFSPDGRLLGSGSLDRTIKLWDVESRECIATLSSGGYPVTFSPDGRLLASGYLKLWDVESRECIITLEGHTSDVSSVAFSPDGRLLASGSQDGTILLWQVISYPPVNQPPVQFADPNLEPAIRDALKMPFKTPEEPIYASDLAVLTKLNSSGRNITDLIGIEHCINLQELDLGDNQISDVGPLSRLTNLQELHLNNNLISDISSLSNMTYLQELWLDRNQISDVGPLSRLTNLQELHLNNNLISDISSLSNMTYLQELWLDRNQISDVGPLSRLTNLQELRLYNNLISDITPLSNMPNLQELRLHGNQISDISPLISSIHLQNLHLSGNQIRDISSLSNMINLWWLDLGNNQIVDISPLSKLTNLQALYLGSNQIIDISSLANFTDLKILYLDWNRIQDISPLEALTEIGETKFPLWEREGIRAHLGLSNNQISDIGPLVSNSGIGEGDGVDLRGNPLTLYSTNNLIPQLQQRGVKLLYKEVDEEHLAIGSNVKVTSTADAGLRIHKGDPTGETVKVVPDGWVFKITGGPQYNIEGHNWWEIQEEKYELSPIKGWVAEDFLEEASPDSFAPSSPPNYFVSAQERVEEAIKWAEGKKGNSDWEELCLRFVSQAYGLGENVNAETTKWTCPNDAMEKLGDKFYAASDCWNPPRGALIFFSATGDYEPYGHIGIYLGDVEAIHAYKTVRIQSLTGNGGIEQLSYTGSYLGWVYPPEEWFLQGNQLPVASFTYSPESPGVGDEITFDASNSNDPDGEIVSCQWDFGEGNTASGERVTHSYDTPYTYIITLTVTDDKGGKGEKMIGLPIPFIGGGSFIMTYSGSPTLKIANLDQDDREQLYNVIEQVLNIGRAKSKLIGEQDESLLGDVNLLLNQLHPGRQDPELAVKDIVRENALSEEQEFLISLGGGIAGVGITFLTGVPAPPLLEEVAKEFGLKLGEWWILRDIGSAIVEYPGGGRMEVVWLRPPKDKIIVNMYLMKSAKRGSMIISVGEWRSELKMEWGVNAYSTVPVWNAFAYPPENTLTDPESIIDHVQIVSLHSPSELRVYDSQGRVTGLVNGEVREEIPSSVYDEERKEAIIFSPSDSYRYEVVGTDEGKYELEVSSVEGGEATTFTATDVPTLPSAVHQYSVDWDALSKSEGKEGVTVQMDSDSDGTFEEIINTGATFTIEEEYPWDVNSDGTIDISDLIVVGQHFGESPPKDSRADVNKDGTVDISDLVLVGQHFGEKAAPPRDNTNLLQQIYDILKTNPNPNPNLKLVLKELERLLAPSETKLLQNYPNPANPETWIPFELSKAADVLIRIYGSNGRLVRKLDLGWKEAGIYGSKGRAAYWDGKNEQGERVASGVYIYQMTVGEKRYLRRMVVVK